MNKKPPKRRKRTSANTDTPRARSHRSAEAATVAWMMALVSTVAAETLGVLTRIALLVTGRNPTLHQLSGTLLLVAALTGLLLLILTPLVLRIRTTPPPKPLVVASFAAGFVPLVTIYLLLSGPQAG